MWVALEEICLREALTLHALCTKIDQSRKGTGLTAAIRVFALAYFRAAATDQGHLKAGHGHLHSPLASERAAALSSAASRSVGPGGARKGTSSR